MNLVERLNVLIQAITLSQKSGVLTLEDAANAKSAIDVISTGTLTQNYASSIDVLIELAVSSQKKGVYSLKDAYMIYLAIEGMNTEFQNEVNRLSGMSAKNDTSEVNGSTPENNSETIISVPTKKTKRSS